ncbi:MAG: threonylcarbamoyl-AMP synthase [Clostridia bacterium]|nr:threonylcarbamoyl-AMP synthase [Clostridia bacterium]
MLFTANEVDLRKVASILKNGGVVAIPTETVYGLAANALDENAVMKIFKAKGRPSDNPLIVHISTVDDMEKYSFPNKTAYNLAGKFWPGPLTMILPKKNNIPSVVSGGLDTVALRLPSHEVARKIIDYSGVPLAAPSANISGRPSPTRAEHVISDFGDKIDGVVDGGFCKFGVESTVISLCGKK